MRASTADADKRTEDYCAISRLINQEAIWFWTFQNTYYAIVKAKLKGLPKMYGGVIDVSRRLAGIAPDARRSSREGCCTCCRSCSPSRC